jgi:hypothetical protein
MHHEGDVAARQRLTQGLVNTPVVPVRSTGAVEPSPGVATVTGTAGLP